MLPKTSLGSENMSLKGEGSMTPRTSDHASISMLPGASSLQTCARYEPLRVKCCSRRLLASGRRKQGRAPLHCATMRLL